MEAKITEIEDMDFFKEESEEDKIKSAQETIKHVTLQQEANEIAESIEKKEKSEEVEEPQIETPEVTKPNKFKEMLKKLDVFISKKGAANKDPNKKNFINKSKEFIKECRRVLKVTKRPDKEEFLTIVKATLLGMAIIGGAGFIIHMTRVLVFN